MTISQRNGTSSVTVNDNAPYTLDRWQAVDSSDGAFTVQQDAGAVTPPAGFTDYLGVTTTTADSSLGASQFSNLLYKIEGNNVADLAWGTANAKTVTLSFWVRSSLTGTFAGSIRNDAGARSYVFNYTISSANTWEYKTITIAGDTSGTWETGTSTGLLLTWSLGAGSNFNATAGSWTAGSFFNSSGAVAPISTLNSTLYLTGVQLEVGSTATSFDYRPFSTEFALCQRYFETNTPYGTAPGNNVGTCWMTSATPNTVYTQYVPFAVSKRSAPTVTVYRGTSGSTNGQWAYYNGSSWVSAVTGIDAKIPGLRGVLSSSPTAHAAWIVEGGWTADSEL